jgi:hypothetical protein
MELGKFPGLGSLNNLISVPIQELVLELELVPVWFLLITIETDGSNPPNWVIYLH